MSLVIYLLSGSIVYYLKLSKEHVRYRKQTLLHQFSFGGKDKQNKREIKLSHFVFKRFHHQFKYAGL